MDETRKPGEAAGLSLQGPHWHREAEAGVDFQPLRLVLQPSGLQIELIRPEMLLGRHSSADIRLPLPDVSRRHCRFVFLDGRWQVFDLNSLNGVFVNDQPVAQATLHHHDLVRIGGFTFQVELPSASPATVAETDGRVLRSIADALPNWERDPHTRQAS